LALDALEMAFTHGHINAFVIVGGDSDFITLVEKLKQYDKRIFVVGGRSFTSNILQRNCHEFIAYENLLKPGDGGRRSRSARESGRRAPDGRPLSAAYPNVQRALKIIAEREVSPQIGLLKSTLLQLDPTFSERDYGAASFLEFMQKMAQENLVGLRRVDRGYLVDLIEGMSEKDSTPASAGDESAEAALPAAEPPAPAEAAPQITDDPARRAEALEILKNVLAAATAKAPNRPLYMRHIRQGLKAAGHDLEDRRLGFRGTLDLLYHAERAGLIRLTRDRNGVLRIFPTGAAQAVAKGEQGPESAVAASSETVVSSGVSADEAAAVATSETIGEVVETVSEEAESPEPPRKRRGRPARGTGRSGQRKSPARRKTKEPREGE
ncbi:MAG: NYN domain-containing protein, partial [Deltaproteobacteria bacterium]